MRLKLLGVASAATALLLSLVPAAFAHPAASEGRTDNDVSFTYESDSGTMPSETSSRRKSDQDGVDFKVKVDESDDSGSGLIGKLRLRLDGEEHATYDGWFSFKVTGEDGEVAFKRMRPATIQLRPQPGHRKASLTFRFDLPSGNYYATGYYEAA